jgi:hypothetical protein
VWVVHCNSDSGCLMLIMSTYNYNGILVITIAVMVIISVIITVVVTMIVMISEVAGMD